MAFKKKHQDHLQTQIHGYRSELRKKRLKQGAILLGIVLLLSSIGYVILRLPLSSPSQKYAYKLFNLEDLSLTQVNEQLSDPNNRIIIESAKGIDTIESLDEYWALMRNRQVPNGQEIAEASMAGEVTVSEIDSMSQLDQDLPPIENPAAVTPEAEQAEGLNANQLEAYQRIGVDIRGDKTAGKRLLFFINNYDPLLQYSISFGNGKRGAIQQYYRYSYNQPGNYVVRLTGSKDGQVVLRKKYDVSIAENKAQRQQNPVEIADNTAVSVENRTPNSTVPSAKPTVEEEVTPVQPEPRETVVSTPSVPQQSSTTSRTPVTTESTSSVSTEAEELVAEETTQPEPRPTVSSTPLKVADVRPSFPGGDAAMLNYLNDKIRYPQAARDHGVEGRVFVQFVVEPSGDLSDIEVVKGLGYGCDKEAVRIVKSMPRWIPGQHQGLKQPVIYTIPVIYQLEDY